MASSEQDLWKNRRKVVFRTLVLCALYIVYVTIKSESNLEFANTKVADTGLTMAFSLAISTVLGYCGFAVWDDSNKLKAKVEDVSTVSDK